MDDIKPDKTSVKAEQPLKFDKEQPQPVAPKPETPPKKNDFAPPEGIKPTKEPKRGGKWMVFVIVLIALILIGAAVWFFLLKDDDSTSSEDETASSEEPIAQMASQAPAPSYELDQIAYAFGVSFDSTADIYLRPAEGGDRESAFELTKIGAVDWGGLGSAEGFIQSEKYAFTINNEDVYVGEPGEKPVKVYTHPGADAEQGIGVQSVVISPDGSMLAFSVLPAGLADPQVWTVGADGEGAAVLLESSKIGPLQWSTDNSKLMLAPNILGAGARLDNPQVVNVATGESEVAYAPDSPHELSTCAFSADGTKFAYIKATADQSRATDDVIGYYVGKPYEVHWIDLASGEDVKVATINENDGPTSVTWQHGEDSFLYSVDSRLVEVDIATGASTNLYETTGGNIDILYASDGETALYGTLESDQTYTVYTVDLDKKDRTEIMQTTDATVAIGIILK